VRECGGYGGVDGCGGGMEEGGVGSGEVGNEEHEDVEPIWPLVVSRGHASDLHGPGHRWSRRLDG
jgi:hypothetical protein